MGINTFANTVYSSLRLNFMPKIPCNLLSFGYGGKSSRISRNEPYTNTLAYIMKEDLKFKTKTGYCHILPDKIVLTRNENLGNLSELIVGKSIIKILIIYGFISIGMIYLSVTNYQNGKMILSIICGVMALYVIYGIIRSLNYSAEPIIDRDKIKSIEFKNAKTGISRAYFKINFIFNEKLKTRLIMLPGSMNNGKVETEKALKIMSDNGLIKKT